MDNLGEQPVMGSLLELGSDDWEVRNLAGATKGEEFHLRVLDCARGKLWAAAVERLMDRMFGQIESAAVPPPPLPPLPLP